jgi:Leucine-rich repeat (LRR) protein
LVELTNLKNLQTLRIIAQGPIDLSPVASLSNLQTLWAWGPITFNTTLLGKLAKLRELTLQGWVGRLSTISDIKTIGELKRLETLTLGQVEATDLEFVRHLDNLKGLSLLQMPVQSLEPLRGLKLLTKYS